jgi:hypothetical protein
VPFLISRMESPLAPHEAQAALKAVVGTYGWCSRPKTPFAGKVSAHGFRIIRVVSGRDSFNPMLYGRFLPAPNGTQVSVVVTWHPIVWLFLCLWVGSILTFMSRDAPRDPIIWLSGLIFIPFPLLLGVPLFFINAAASIRCLRETLHLPES